jgi:dihydrofolate synthase/folylpolyglutamate synthase
MFYRRTVDYLYGLQQRGMKFGLRGIKGLLKVLGNPHRRFYSIHIAGTNGKGSTAALIAAALTSAGYRTGLYTSPHLIEFSERIRIDGKPITRAAVVEFTNKLRRPIEHQQATFFEATTAMAFGYFAQQKVDVAVIETGLGGRLDSTNVLRPVVSVITSIGFDHQEILGDTIQQIAREKAGIIKRGVPCISGVRSAAARKMIRRACLSSRSKLVEQVRLRPRVRKESLLGMSLDVKIGKKKYENLFVSLAGSFQVSNILTALLTLEALDQSGKFIVPEEAIRTGFANVQALTGLFGRLSIAHHQPTVIVDVAHNPDAVGKLVQSLKALHLSGLLVVFGVMNDKDHSEMARLLAPLVKEAVAVSAKTPRSRSASDMTSVFRRLNVPVTAASSVREGVRLALKRVGRNGTILVTGSHYVVGEALLALRDKKIP